MFIVLSEGNLLFSCVTQVSDSAQHALPWLASMR